MVQFHTDQIIKMISYSKGVLERYVNMNTNDHGTQTLKIILIAVTFNLGVLLHSPPPIPMLIKHG
jgi:hypothetical protein